MLYLHLGPSHVSKYLSNLIKDVSGFMFNGRWFYISGHNVFKLLSPFHLFIYTFFTNVADHHLKTYD